MGKTLRTFKGITHPQSKEKKAGPDKKFFGHTSGSHSRGIYDRILIDGKIEYVKSDRAPIKGQDFIKYGWPLDLRSKPMREY